MLKLPVLYPLPQLKPSQAGVSVGYVLFAALLLLAAAVVGLRITQTELKAPQASVQLDAITAIGHAVQIKQSTAVLVHDAREKLPTVIWTGLSSAAIDPATGQSRLALTSGTTTFTSDFTVPAGWGVYATTYSGVFVAYAYSPLIASNTACSDLNFRLGNGKSTPSASYNIASAQISSNIYLAITAQNKDATGSITDMVCKSFNDGRRLMVTLFQQKL